MADELLYCKNLSKTFEQHPVLKDIDLSIERGQIVALLGKNGAGKTTLIKLINDLLTPDQGEVLILGQTPGLESKKMVSYLPERTYLDKSMKVSGAIRLFEDFYEDFDSDKAHRLIAEMGLEENKKIAKLSKGMLEKLQLALVLSRKASLFILDEPLSGVDPATRDKILDLILENFSRDSSLLISTHLISDVERIIDKVIFLDDGKIVYQGDADKLRDEAGGSIDEIFRRRFS